MKLLMQWALWRLLLFIGWKVKILGGIILDLGWKIVDMGARRYTSEFEQHKNRRY